MKRVLLVNGVPASGKSTVARMIADAEGWPLLTLDSLKEALFAHLGTGDREYNRLLGRASYQAIFAAIADFPAGTTTIVDAWFGFQPLQVLQDHLARACAVAIAEIWCHAPAAIIGARYRTRLGQRHAGHLGESYVPELVALAESAAPLGAYPQFDIETTQPIDLPIVRAWLANAFGK